MERIIDVFTKQGHRHIWTYSIILSGSGFHPSLIDLEREAIRRADDDHHKTRTGELTAKVRHR